MRKIPPPIIDYCFTQFRGNTNQLSLINGRLQSATSHYRLDQREIRVRDVY